MEAMLAARSLVPAGYDSGLLLDDDPPLFADWEFDQAIMRESYQGEMLWAVDSSPATLSSRSDAAKSPSRQTHPPSTEGSSSLSPGGHSLILTPTSTLLDYTEGTALGDPESGEQTDSSESNLSPSEEFVMVPRFGGESNAARRTRVNRPPPHASGAVPSARPSHQSRESSLSHSHSSQSIPAVQWGSLASSASSSWMEQQHASQQRQQQQQQQQHPENAYPASADIDFANPYATDELFSNVTAFDSTPFVSYDNLPFRTVEAPSNLNAFNHTHHGDSVFESHPHTQPTNAASLYVPTSAQHQAPHQYDAQDFAYTQAQLLASPMRHPQQQQQIAYPTVGRPQMQSGVLGVSSSPNLSVHTTALTRHDPHLSQAAALNLYAPASHDHTLPSAAVLPSSSAPVSARAGQQILVKSEARPTTGAMRSTHHTSARKGGRSKNSHLPEESRQKSSEMRKVGACWRCALQRDPCDHGDPCNRCMTRLGKGQTYYFDCDRSKLPDFVHDFLPPSMTFMHQKQSIEDCVSEQVLSWDRDNGIDIFLSSGYGPALPWKLYEFTPRSEDLLNQLQYFQDPTTGQVLRRYKYSPPYGLLKLDTSDDAHFEEYLDLLLCDEHLKRFGWNCYEEETLMDPDAFQATLLDLMCKLYTKTTDNNLKPLLRDILRMMIITYIMGHTLTILQDTLWSVIGNVRHTPKPHQVLPHTSPRLANRQLKFFFAVLRGNIYEKILKWQQATLHTAGKKEATWLPTFCVMLGFAMVLEEIERTIHIQADAKAARRELSPENAHTEAFNACERIDGRFKLLVGLFQCKYRDKKWGDRGSFGPGTPELSDPAANEFLRALRSLVEARSDHLRRRQHVTFSRENQCLYTTRLTARFLLPFLNLPS